jgi:hypothetical protein
VNGRGWLAAAALVLAAPALAAAAGPEGDAAAGRRFVPVRRFPAEEARQAVAVDVAHFYAIDDRRIGKYDKRTGLRVASWSAPEGSPIVHLNSGIVLGGRLLCAHSNYPALPMRSSIEIFDPARLAHAESQPLDVADGSATWIDRHGGGSWVAFANYAGRGGVPGRGPEETFVQRFDAGFRPLGRLAFPAEVVRRFGGRSNSGGAFGPDGLLYATGHDAPELYVLRAPTAGTALLLVEIVELPIAGQGIAFDPDEPDLLWTILRGSREVVVWRLAAPRH